MALAAHHRSAHRFRPAAILEQNLRQDATFETALDEADPEIPILAAVPHRFVEAADHLDRGTADERGAVHGVHVEEKRRGVHCDRSAPPGHGTAKGHPVRKRSSVGEACVAAVRRIHIG